MKNCKFVSKKRRFCRKAKNTRRRRHRGGNNEADVQAPDVQAQKSGWYQVHFHTLWQTFQAATDS